jgi:4-amino-4-deoxy-L-arabinose transferase-like glycosyltransferase
MFAGTSETALRLPSAIYGTFFVLAAVWAGCEFCNRQVGLWSGAFAAIAPIHIYYSQEARPYALLTLLLLLCAILLDRALREDSTLSWALVTLAVLLALYTHYFAILGLLPAALLILIGADRARLRQRLWRLGGITFVCGVLFLPWVWWSFMLTPHSPAETEWIRNTWNETPPTLAIPKTLEVLALGADAGFFPHFPKLYSYITFPRPLRLLGLALMLLLGIWVAIPWQDHRLPIHWLRERKVWLWGMLLFPLGTLWLLSLAKPLYLVGRYDLVAFPGYTLLVGVAMAKMQRAGKIGSILTVCVAVTLLAVIGTKLVRYYEVPPRPLVSSYSPWDTAAFLDKVVRQGDIVLFTGLRGLPVLYYFHRGGIAWTGRMCEERAIQRQFACRMFPRETDRAPATYDPDRVRYSAGAIRDDLRDILSGVSQPDVRIWLVMYVVGYSEGRIVFLPEDYPLEADLERLGFEPIPTDDAVAMGIHQFMRRKL